MLGSDCSAKTPVVSARCRWFNSEGSSNAIPITSSVTKVATGAARNRKKARADSRRCSASRPTRFTLAVAAGLVLIRGRAFDVRGCFAAESAFFECENTVAQTID